MNQSMEERIAELEDAIRKHRDQRGDDRCWMDDQELYAHLPEGVGTADLRLPPPEEMLANCQRFIACRHDPRAEYRSAEREVDAAEAWAKAAGARLDEVIRRARRLLKASNAGREAIGEILRPVLGIVTPQERAYERAVVRTRTEWDLRQPVFTERQAAADDLAALIGPE